jgi:hypothetical protein
MSMGRWSISRDVYYWVILLTLLTLTSGIYPSGAHARGRKGVTYDGAVDFGVQQVHLDDGCLAVDGTVKSGKFFEDLKRLDNNAQAEYRKAGKVVKEYPQSLTTSIRVMGDRCADGLLNATAAVFGSGSYSLTFKVAWKDGMQLRPAALSPVVAECVGSRVSTNPGGDSIFPAITCQLTVDSKGVSLDNHLIVSVFAPDGTRITRLSAAP